MLQTGIALCKKEWLKEGKQSYPAEIINHRNSSSDCTVQSAKTRIADDTASTSWYSWFSWTNKINNGPTDEFSQKITDKRKLQVQKKSSVSSHLGTSRSGRLSATASLKASGYCFWIRVFNDLKNKIKQNPDSNFILTSKHSRALICWSRQQSLLHAGFWPIQKRNDAESKEIVIKDRIKHHTRFSEIRNLGQSSWTWEGVCSGRSRSPLQWSYAPKNHWNETAPRCCLATFRVCAYPIHHETQSKMKQSYENSVTERREGNAETIHEQLLML